MSYVHLRRYGKKPGAAEVAAVDVICDGQVVYKGQIYDLRTAEKGAKHAGFAHHLDGRYLQWSASDGFLEVHHADGRVVSVQVVGGKPIALVGRYLVHADDSRQPWLVIDTQTGELVGHVEDQRGDATYGTVLYTPMWFDPKNERSLWLCEGSRLAELDVEKRRMARAIEAEPEFAFVGVAALPDGHVITLVRSLEDKTRHSRESDRLVLFSPAGERLRQVGVFAQAIHRLGDGFIVSDDRREQFVIYDRALEPIATVEMYEPGKDGYNVPLPLPSGREWIALGGRGEWDHYDEPELAPKTKKPARSPARKPKK